MILLRNKPSLHKSVKLVKSVRHLSPEALRSPARDVRRLFLDFNLVFSTQGCPDIEMPRDEKVVRIKAKSQVRQWPNRISRVKYRNHLIHLSPRPPPSYLAGAIPQSTTASKSTTSPGPQSFTSSEAKVCNCLLFSHSLRYPSRAKNRTEHY